MRLLFALLFWSSAAWAQFVYPLTVDSNGSIINSQTLVLNFTSGCTPTKSGSTTNVTCPGTGLTSSEWSFSTYTATHAAATGIHAQTTVKNASTIQASNFVVDTPGTGGGNMTCSVCSDGATCGAGNVYTTCTVSCAASAGTVVSCTVNKSAVAANTTLSWTVTGVCGTNDVGGNMAAHLTAP